MSQTRPVYRFSDNATSSQANEYGNYILKRGAGEVRKPSWNRTDTVVRLLPYWDGEQWSPFRYSPEPMQFGDWIRRYDAVRGFGENGITMLLYDPVTNPTYDVQSNPCVVLYRAINNAIDNRQCEPDWPALLKGGAGRRAVLGRHGPLYLSRCGIFRIKSKDMATRERSPLGLSPGDPCYFLEIPKTAGEKLIAMLEERTENYQGDPYDYDQMFKYGDIVSLDKGAYVTIFEEGADPRPAKVESNVPRQIVVSGGGRGSYGGGGGGGSQFKGYDMYIEKEWNGYPSNLASEDIERLIKSKQRTWEDSLQFFSNQEQAFLVQDGFPAKAIMYAWRDRPEWIKDETRSKAAGRVSEMPQFDTTPARPVVSPPKAPTSVKIDPNARVGGWGTSPAEDEDMRDVVVPVALPETPVDAGREAKAQKALEEAKARATSRKK